MKNKTRGVLFSLAMTLLLMSFPALANIVVEAEVQYGQTEARTMLDMINSFRTGSEAWYWNSDNTEKIYVKDLQPLEYDKKLEIAAMQRAAEIALHYSHTRPNGEASFSAMDEAGVEWWSVGENIAAGYESAQSVFVGWQETDDPYSGQGHRRNMLSSSFNRVGFGHVILNGWDYWVQEFARVEETAEDAGNAVDDMVSARITVSEDLITEFTCDSFNPDPLFLNYEETSALPVANCTLLMTEAWPGGSSSVTVHPAWTSTNTSCVTVTETEATGHAVGNAALTASLAGNTLTVPVNVTYAGTLEPDYTLPASLTTLEAEALQGTDASSVLIPVSLQEIGSKAFSSCASLAQITFMSDEVVIADDAFENCPNPIIFFCREGSSAESFAAVHGITTVRIL